MAAPPRSALTHVAQQETAKRKIQNKKHRLHVIAFSRDEPGHSQSANKLAQTRPKSNWKCKSQTVCQTRPCLCHTCKTRQKPGAHDKAENRTRQNPARYIIHVQTLPPHTIVPGWLFRHGLINKLSATSGAQALHGILKVEARSSWKALHAISDRHLAGFN